MYRFRDYFLTGSQFARVTSLDPSVYYDEAFKRKYKKGTEDLVLLTCGKYTKTYKFNKCGCNLKLHSLVPVREVLHYLYWSYYYRVPMTYEEFFFYNSNEYLCQHSLMVCGSNEMLGYMV